MSWSNSTQSSAPSFISASGSGLGSQLMQILLADDIVPGSDPSYQTCKILYAYHPLGGKIVDAPIDKAMTDRRVIAIDGAPDEIIERFEDEWTALRIDDVIAATMRIARIYGIGSVVACSTETSPEQPLDLWKIAKESLYFSVFDPLNTSGSLVLDQNPESPNFQKIMAISVSGHAYHPSRTRVMQNEAPIYILWTASSFGYVGRSVFQRCLFPMKSFIQTMISDDMISAKLGLLIAKVRQPGSIINNLMSGIAGIKRTLLQTGVTNNVLSIAPEESIETLNMMNVDGAGKFSRENILKNIAVAAGMPASWLNEETLTEGFGEGTEDAKKEAMYITRMRLQMLPLYDFCDDLVMHRAWGEEFYATVRAKYPDEYGDTEYKTAFMAWKNAFKAKWPNILQEPDSEKSKAQKVQTEAVISLVEKLLPALDPENKARLVQWAVDNFNEFKLLFPVPLDFDFDEFASYEPPAAEAPPSSGEQRPDSVMELRNTVVRAA